MMNLPSFRMLLFLLAWVVSITRVASVAAVLQVGTAQRDITPVEPVPMWGYGGRHDSLSVGVIDPLSAVALVLEVGGSKIAIVSLDLGRSPSENSLQTIRKRIQAEAGIQHSFIAGSHSHHGPVLELSDEEGNFQIFEPLDFLAEVTQHVPEPGEHLIRYYGWYSNKKRGLRAKAKTKDASSEGNGESILGPDRKTARKRWAALIKQVYETDPLLCPKCGGEMKIISFIERHQSEVIEKILKHCGMWQDESARAPPEEAMTG